MLGTEAEWHPPPWSCLQASDRDAGSGEKERGSPGLRGAGSRGHPGGDPAFCTLHPFPQLLPEGDTRPPRDGAQL